MEINKYFLRAAIMHLGMDIDIGLGGAYYIIREFSNTMAGVQARVLPIEIQSSSDNIVSYTFTTPEGGYLVALWTDGIAVDDDPGIQATVTVPGFSASQVIGIDIMNLHKQELIYEMVNGDLVISNLMVKDYPILIKLNLAAP